jgi:hypothetical protein
MAETDQLTIVLDKYHIPSLQLTASSDITMPEDVDTTDMPESTASSSAAAKTFRFLDLPVDIRTMVYEQLISDTVDEMLAHTQEREFTIILDKL